MGTHKFSPQACFLHVHQPPPTSFFQQHLLCSPLDPTCVSVFQAFLLSQPLPVPPALRIGVAVQCVTAQGGLGWVLPPASSGLEQARQGSTGSRKCLAAQLPAGMPGLLHQVQLPANSSLFPKLTIQTNQLSAAICCI